LGSLNSTFLALIPKKQDHASFEDFRPIACCNLIYKLVAKIIANHLKPIFSDQKTNSVSLTQEALHFIKLKNIPSIVMKLDLSKAYDKVSWTFVRLPLIQMAMDLKMVNWIMGCIESSSFAVLINGTPSQFFQASRELSPGMSPIPLPFPNHCWGT
jgi:hypothetical protein